MSNALTVQQVQTLHDAYLQDASNLVYMVETAFDGIDRHVFPNVSAAIDYANANECELTHPDDIDQWVIYPEVIATEPECATICSWPASRQPSNSWLVRILALTPANWVNRQAIIPAELLEWSKP